MSSFTTLIFYVRKLCYSKCQKLSTNENKHDKTPCTNIYKRSNIVWQFDRMLSLKVTITTPTMI